jgi:hypothetical protein
MTDPSNPPSPNEPAPTPPSIGAPPPVPQPYGSAPAPLPAPVPAAPPGAPAPYGAPPTPYGTAPAPYGVGEASAGQKSFVATWLLSWLVGIWGVDRFYLGKVGTGLLKLFTLGGLGVWWLIDLILVLAGAQRDSRGQRLAGYDQHKKVAWIVTGALLALGLVINIINGAAAGTRGALDASNDRPAVVIETDAAAEESAAAKASDEAAEEPAAEPEPKPELVVVPGGLIGMTAADAEGALRALGLEVTYDGDATAKVLSVSPADASVEAGTTITLTVEQAPAMTMGQEQAVGSAKSYLSFTAFSRSGLIEQLEYEGFSNADATFAVDFVAPDWNAQATASAKSYLEMTSFSRDGLIEQLVYEGFTPEQAEFGATANGY